MTHSESISQTITHSESEAKPTIDLSAINKKKVRRLTSNDNNLLSLEKSSSNFNKQIAPIETQIFKKSSTQRYDEIVNRLG